MASLTRATYFIDINVGMFVPSSIMRNAVSRSFRHGSALQRRDGAPLPYQLSPVRSRMKRSRRWLMVSGCSISAA